MSEEVESPEASIFQTQMNNILYELKVMYDKMTTDKRKVVDLEYNTVGLLSHAIYKARDSGMRNTLDLSEITKTIKNLKKLLQYDKEHINDQLETLNLLNKEIEKIESKKESL